MSKHWFISAVVLCLAGSTTFAQERPDEAGDEKPDEDEQQPAPEGDKQPTADGDTQSGADGDEPLKIEAEKHYNTALAHYEVKLYGQAAAEFARAYEIDPRPRLLFAWAQAERLAGNCPKAIELYHQVRKQTVSDEDKLAILEGLERCNAFDQTRTTPATNPTPAPQPAATPRDEASPWYSDWLGNSLVVGGVVGLGVGTSMWLVSSRQHDDAESAATYGEHVSLEDRAKRNRIISIVSLTAGTALVAGGIARYLTRDTGEDSVAASAWLGTDGGGLAVGGRF